MIWEGDKNRRMMGLGLWANETSRYEKGWWWLVEEFGKLVLSANESDRFHLPSVLIPEN